MSSLPRAMEMHAALGIAAVVSTVFPWALLFVAAALGYIVYYCAACGSAARLDVLAARPERAAWSERLKWRAAIAGLHFLEPLARDWGRLKGGLTPWRPALGGDAERLRPLTTRWWRRLQPFRRTLAWSRQGGMELEKHGLLERLTQMLSRRRCSVGWNSDFESWDLEVRRGALGEAWLRLAVEHHGGMRRAARFSADIRPSRTIRWALGIVAALASVTAALGSPLPAAVLFLLLAGLWIAPIREADRLERGLRDAADEVCAALAAAASTREDGR